MLTSDKDLHCNLYFNSQFTNCFITWLALLGNQVQYYVSKHGISKLFCQKRFFLYVFSWVLMYIHARNVIKQLVYSLACAIKLWSV